jgi:hypothetical protein
VVGCVCHEAISESKDIKHCLYPMRKCGFRGSEWIAVCVRCTRLRIRFACAGS